MEVQMRRLTVTLRLLFLSFWMAVGKSRGQEDACRTLLFIPPLDGQALVSHVIRNISLEGQDACQVSCYLDNDCLSYNYGRIQDGSHIYQLSDTDHVQHPEDLQPQGGFSYVGTENDCSSNPCSLNGKCVIDARDNRYRCKCQTGYDGQNCETDGWKKINNDPVCFKARDNKYGTFEITQEGFIRTFKLVHRSGSLTCNTHFPNSYWGCTNDRVHDGNKNLLTVITFTNNTVLPIAEFSKLDGCSRTYVYHLDGFDLNSPELVFNQLPSPLPVTRGQQFKIWYGHDLTDCSEDNNRGRTCADVYAWYSLPLPKEP